MQTVEYRVVDKSQWGVGPWQSEPDKKQWQDEATGLPCLIVRGPVGALCGYVGVPSGHPWGDLANAYASMISDMGKHNECRVASEIAMIGMMEVMNSNATGLERFIEGFR